jgi:hypothetical protein
MMPCQIAMYVFENENVPYTAVGGFIGGTPSIFKTIHVNDMLVSLNNVHSLTNQCQTRHA